MKNEHVRKLITSGMLTALIVVLSGFYIPIGASKCFPIQHMVNVLAAVLLGPGWGVGIAFCASLIRNFMGTGTLLAFPGSMVGALCCGLMYHYTKKLVPTCIAEVVGTGFLGGLLAYPVAAFFMGREGALFAYVLPFFVSTFGGTVIAFCLIGILQKAGAVRYLRNILEN